MPPAHVGIDRLWSCLRSALGSATSPNSYRLISPPRTSLKICGSSLPCLASAKKPIVLCTRSYYSVVRNSKELPKPHEATRVDKLYHKLDRLKFKAEDFLWIYENVGELVGQHGEAPNRRMFLALILANTDAQHGSTTEVMRLLEEMTQSGIEPDSATYHAVLKVDRYRETLSRV